jgi:dephospho-CoA kinase
MEPGRVSSAATPVPCIGLTGGIGAGKSAALAAFRTRGAATLSSDEVVHALYRRPDVVARVVERFGTGVLDADGRVDRTALGARAFAEEGGIAHLQGILYPLIGEERERWIAAERSRVPPPPLLVCEVPLLFEAGLRDLFDEVVVVTAPEAVRRARVEARGQVFAQRADLQWSEAAKVAAADRHYVNDGDLEALDAWVDAVMRDLTAARP